ncbi:hypothetical protein [Spirillospora sp. NPDC047279]
MRAANLAGGPSARGRPAGIRCGARTGPDLGVDHAAHRPGPAR